MTSPSSSRGLWAVLGGAALLGLAAIFVKWSVAGGAVRRNGPAHYWYWTETDTIAAGVRENIIAPYFCELRTSVPASDRERVELLTEDGAAISRSTGWQWIDAGSTQLRVLGADCDRLVDRRATVRFVSRSSLCEI